MHAEDEVGGRWNLFDLYEPAALCAAISESLPGGSHPIAALYVDEDEESQPMLMVRINLKSVGFLHELCEVRWTLIPQSSH